MKKITLENIFEDDLEGLLELKPKQSIFRSDENRLVDSFLEINKFMEEYGREPIVGSNDLKEHTLASRLKGIREDEEKIKTLIDLDIYSLLSIEKKEVNSVEDILDDDDFGLLELDKESIFKIKNVPIMDRDSTDFVARRKPVKDFSKYEPIFKRIHEDIIDGTRKIQKYSNEDQLKRGNFYIAGGIMFLLESFKLTRVDHYKPGGIRVRKDGRTRCVFENGLYSNMLFRSVSKLLHISNGKIITNPGESLFDYQNINSDDSETGYIYILKSLSKDPKINEIQNLYKIGYSKIEVENRIKDAENDPTYLMSNVIIIKVYKCFNLNPQKMEHLLHTFFGEARLLIDIYDKDRKRYTPKEWFIAPLEIIDQAVRMVISGEIIDYKYDQNNERITIVE